MIGVCPKIVCTANYLRYNLNEQEVTVAKSKSTKEIVPLTIHPVFQHHFCYSLSKAGTLFRGLLETTLKSHKLVAPQAGIIRILAGHGEYNQNQLAQEMNMDKASMVKFIDGLEKHGYVKRSTDPKDRRSKLLTITAKGRVLEKKIIEQHTELEEEILKQFPAEDQQTLRRLMPQVLQAVLNYYNK